MSKKAIGLFLGPLLFILTIYFFKPEDLSEEGRAVLACTLWIAVWWILEVIPIAVTALLPIILFPLTGALNLSDTTATYGHKYVFLYIGGFMLAIAIERWNLHKRIALTVINLIGTNIKSMILGFMVATAFLSMWISNTATSVMMLPIGMAIISQLKDNPDTLEDENLIFGKALMLSIAYSASIGGIATLIGTPPNLVFAGVIEEIYNIKISFAQWIIVGLPISIIMLFISWKYLTERAFKFTQTTFPGGREEIRRLLNDLGKISYAEKVVLVVFVTTAIAWITRSYLLTPLLAKVGITGLDDTIIAMIAGISLFLLPADRKNNRSILKWEEAVKLPWGILLLFGGGLALAAGFKTSGLAEWIGMQMTGLNGMSILLVVLILVAAVNFLTEITSNLATTAMILPILAPLALELDVHPYLLMVGATIGASCAFMLPVATPPNAVVFGSGYLTIPDMLKAGVWLNVISIIIITGLVYFVLPLLWNFSPDVFPSSFQ